MSSSHTSGVLPTRTPAVLLEALAVAVMSTDAADEVGVRALIALFEELGRCAGPFESSATAMAGRLRAAVPDGEALAAALDAASEEVARMQDVLARGGQEPAPEAAPQAAAAAGPEPEAGRFVLPEWADEKTLSDFLTAQRSSLEELEGLILGMEKGDPEPRAAFKRRLHTLKGEAGVLGLDDLEQVCHATEDFLESRGVSADVTDRLLRVRDWMARALDGYAAMRLPEPRAAELVPAVLVGPGPGAAAGGGPGAGGARRGDDRALRRVPLRERRGARPRRPDPDERGARRRQRRHGQQPLPRLPHREGHRRLPRPDRGGGARARDGDDAEQVPRGRARPRGPGDRPRLRRHLGAARDAGGGPPGRRERHRLPAPRGAGGAHPRHPGRHRGAAGGGAGAAGGAAGRAAGRGDHPPPPRHRARAGGEGGGAPGGVGAAPGRGAGGHRGCRAGAGGAGAPGPERAWPSPTATAR